MVEELKDGVPQGSERGHSVKLVVHQLFNHSDAKVCHCCQVCTKLKQYAFREKSLKLVLQSVINISNRFSDH
jgi:hypothetical protein